MPFQGYYINLDRNEVRRRALETHLAERGLAHRYQRVPGVDGRAVADQHPIQLDPGNIGCWLSHRKILEANPRPDEHLHIIEDDTIFAANVLSSFDMVLEFADQTVSDWDLIFTDAYISPAD